MPEDKKDDKFLDVSADDEDQTVRFAAPINGKRVNFRITLSKNRRLGPDGINLTLTPDDPEELRAVTGMTVPSQNERDFALLATIFRLLSPRKIPAISRWDDLEDD